MPVVNKHTGDVKGIAIPFVQLQLAWPYDRSFTSNTRVYRLPRLYCREADINHTDFTCWTCHSTDGRRFQSPAAVVGVVLDSGNRISSTAMSRLP
jgi:hypothetical protein